MSPASTEVETVTLGEVNRNLNRVASMVEELKKDVADYPKWPDIKRVESGLDKRIANLESWVKWAGRTLLGALATGAVALLFVLR